MGPQLAAWYEEALKVDEAGFVSAHPWPVLLYNPEEFSDPQHMFKTAVDLQGPTSRQTEVPLTRRTMVMVVEPDTSATSQSRVTVGRTKNTNLCLPTPKISKLHAFFTWNPERTEYQLTDAGSTNGTYVGGVRLEPRKAVSLASEELINFWYLGFRFCMPERMYALLRAMG